MSDNNLDGNLADVNPLLLQMSSNAEAWKQQRREAMLKKVFGNKNERETTGGGNDAASITPDQFMPLRMPEDEASASRSDTRAGGPSHSSGDEKYVLQQLMSMKRRRDDDSGSSGMAPAGAPHTSSTAATTPQLQPASSQQLSAKDRLMQKFGGRPNGN